MNLDRRLLRQTRAVRLFLVLTIGLGVLLGILTVIQAGLISRTINLAFLDGRSLIDVRAWLFGLLIVIALRAVLTWGSEVSAFQIAARVKLELRERVFGHLMALGPAYARGERTGELTNTVIEGIESLEAYFSQYLPQLALAALVPLTVLGVVFPVDLLSAVVLLLTGPLIPLFMILIGKAADALTRKQYKSLSLLSAHFLDVMQGLTTLKMLGRSQVQAEAIAQVSDRFRETTLRVLRVAFLSAFALEMIGTISTAIVAVEVGLRLLYGTLQFEQAFFVLILAPDFYLPLRLLGTRFHAGLSGVTAARRIFEILDTPLPRHSEPRGGEESHSVVRETLRCAHARSAASGRSDSGDGAPGGGDIRFENVHVAYDDGRRSALNGVSFEMQHGRRTALVGPTGSGKSTLAHLLLRFVEPQSGSIEVNGLSLGDLPVREWRAQIAWVPQNPYLFHETAAANIRKARPDAPMGDVIRAAQQAHADEFIRALPQGYDTPIGERGARLSGGQAQRIALARAFLKDAPILILDEATSNLDSVQENLIQNAIEQLMQNRTVLIITHRLNTIARADQIVMLAKGRVIESGTHESLVREQGAYYRLVRAGRTMKDGSRSADAMGTM